MQLEMLLIIIVHIDVQIFATILLSVNLLYSYKNSVEIKGILYFVKKIGENVCESKRNTIFND